MSEVENISLNNSAKRKVITNNLKKRKKEKKRFGACREIVPGDPRHLTLRK